MAKISAMLIVPDADGAIAWYEQALGATDPDAVVERAVAYGVQPGAPVADHEHSWGTHRQGGFKDPFGHNWSVGDDSPLR